MFEPQKKPIKETPVEKRTRQLKHAYEHKLQKAQERIEKLKTKVKRKPDNMQVIKKRVQSLVNKYVRLRDAGQGCIACGKPIDGSGHASHYASQGMHGFLRYNLDNLSLSCVHCNVWLRGNLIRYRINLVKKIGLERVEYLEAHMNDIKRWTREELLEIEADIKSKVQALAKGKI
jgi:hypothetical protein